MGSEPDIRDRAAEVEARLARLHRRLGIEGDPIRGTRPGGFSADVLDLVAEGRTADAARRHRDETGCDMPTALAAVAGIDLVG